jgi:esterase/lipase superfamily enzyme
MVEIYFATNRNRLLNPGGMAEFGQLAGPGSQGIAFGTATVEDISLDQPDAGTITSCEVVNFGGIGPELAAKILGGDRDILVFVHGAANTFTDALRRAAFNVTWLNNQGGRQFTMLAFSWPARDYQLWNILEDLEDYKQDQMQAQASAPHFVEFLQAVSRLRSQLGSRRMTMLAHSMGNYMLGFGIERWFADPRPPVQLFDAVVLAAADEQSNTFGLPAAGRMSDLWELTPEVTVYSSREDVLMLASHIANGDWRLGFDGPPNRADTRFFSTDHYKFIDCTAIQDFTASFIDAPDRTHQYYRQSETVRSDIGRLMRREGAPVETRIYDGSKNAFTLPVQGAGPTKATT